MRDWLKSLCMLFPSLRRLHEERNRYASEVNALTKRLAASEDAYISVQNELDGLRLEKKEFLTEIEKFAQPVLKKITQRLHVVGYARSGTTILMDILNSSKDVFLFSEFNLHVLRKFPDIFSAYGGDGFVEHFAQRKRKELPIIYKSALPPSTKLDYLTPDQYVDSVGQNYRYVGDKIATAYRSIGGVPDIELLKDFLKQEDEGGAILIFTLRRPSENLLSVSKMFPEADLQQWARSIAEATVAIIESFLSGNQSYLVFCEDIGPNLIVEISELLGVRCALSSELVGTVYQTTKENNLLFDVAGLGTLDEAFDELYDIYRCDESIIKHSKTDALIKKISLVIGKIQNHFDGAYSSNADIREESDKGMSSCSSIRSVWVDDARGIPQLLSSGAIRKIIVESFHSIYGKDREDNYSKSLSLSGFEFFEEIIRRVHCRGTIRYLEIGSFEGVSMVVVALLLRNSGYNAVLTSIDPYSEDGYWENNPVLGEMFKVSDKSIKKKALSFYEAMGLNVEHFEDVSNVVLIDLLRKERSFDLIYVDGYHEKTVPLEDIALSMSLLSEDGVLIIDDWIWPDVLPIKNLFDLHMEKIVEHPMMVAYRRKKTS